MNKSFHALILSGDGINCEQETEAACREAGFKTQIVHCNDLLGKSDELLSQANLFVIPGGFSFGDELGSGQILALKLKHGLQKPLEHYIQKGMAVLGICNGFQVLVRLGLFGKGVLLIQNSSGHFQNKWVTMKLSGKSIFTNPLSPSTSLELPIRHGEGRLWFEKESIADQMFENGQCVLQYNEDVNGSWKQVAALSGYDGLVLGMMPHPEAFWCNELHPWGENRNVPLGTRFFENAFDYFKSKNYCKGENSS